MRLEKGHDSLRLKHTLRRILTEALTVPAPVIWIFTPTRSPSYIVRYTASSSNLTSKMNVFSCVNLAKRKKVTEEVSRQISMRTEEKTVICHLWGHFWHFHIRQSRAAVADACYISCNSCLNTIEIENCSTDKVCPEWPTFIQTAFYMDNRSGLSTKFRILIICRRFRLAPLLQLTFKSRIGSQYVCTPEKKIHAFTELCKRQ